MQKTNGGVFLKVRKSTKNAVQSWAEFCQQSDSNTAPHDTKLGAQPLRHADASSILTKIPFERFYCIYWKQNSLETLKLLEKC